MKKVIPYILAIGLALFVLLPFLWMFSTAVKPLKETFSWPPYLIPHDWSLENFPISVQRSNAIRALLVSSIYTVGCIVLYLIVASLAGYGFAKYKFPGDSILFLLVLGTVIIPIEVIIAPLFMLLKSLGWVNTFHGMILPRVVEPFGIFLLRQHFKTIPDDFLDAARIDGCSEFGILWKVVLPLSLPPLTVTGLFMFLWRWNELLWPLVVGSGEAQRTIQVAIALFQHEWFVEWNYLMALCVIAIIPILILFILLQRYFIQGVVMSGLKG
ncbi:MAG TPA: carbohydrate ABC transporter permease [Firmicutes bacterium]|nr:carbohydrate ABC transporter permease [Bacillota bacterium]